jgi:ABC-type multidrug transport system fused ATPase/permease subunit
LSIGTGLGYPQVVRLIIDQGVQAGHLHQLNQLSLIMVGILLVEAMATFVRDYCFNLGAERVGARLRRSVFRTLLAQTSSSSTAATRVKSRRGFQPTFRCFNTSWEKNWAMRSGSRCSPCAARASLLRRPTPDCSRCWRCRRLSSPPRRSDGE